MREIRFRAWIPAGHWAGKKDKPIMYYNWQDSVFVEVLTLVPGPNEGIRIMQYTGLKDKNVKEIYEGDILKMDSEEDQSTFEVVWKFNGWRKKFTDWPDDLPEYNLLSRGDLGFYKIIGNIYENPELLERP